MFRILRKAGVCIRIGLFTAADLVLAYNPYFHRHTDALDRLFGGFRWYRRLAHCDWSLDRTRWIRILPGRDGGAAERENYSAQV